MAASSSDPGRGGGDQRVEVSSVRPEPSPDELAAIVAALEMAWPEPVRQRSPEASVRWRFSGRWWSKPVPVRRERP